MKTMIGTMASKQHLQRSDDGGVREPLRAGERRPVAVLRAVRRHAAADDRARLQEGGFAVPKDLTRADYRASWAKMVDLLGRMHKAGVPIVAGTDGAGIELVHELEIYVQAGFTPAEALAAATIVPARLVGQDEGPGRSRSARPPIWRWSTAIRRRESATCVRRAS